MTAKTNVGIQAFLREGRYVAYDYIFDEILYKTLNMILNH